MLQRSTNSALALVLKKMALVSSWTLLKGHAFVLNVQSIALALALLVKVLITSLVTVCLQYSYGNTQLLKGLGQGPHFPQHLGE